MQELTARAAELERQGAVMDDAPEWSADEADCIDLEEQAIAERRNAIHEALKTWRPEAKAHAGVIVTVNREGDVEVIRGLVREADRKALAASRKVAAVAVDGPAGDAPSESRSPARRTAGCSESLLRRLAAHRTLALQATLSRNTHVALATLAHVFVQRVFGEDSHGARSALQVTMQCPTHHLLAAADDLKTCPAWLALEAAKAGSVERLPEQRSEWLGWLIGLAQSELLNLLAHCAASTLNALPSAGATFSSNAIADAVDLDMADWWTPTADGYLKHVSKAQIVQALKEVGPDLVADGVGEVKKDVLVVKAASRLAGKRWLPAPLRRAMV